jgi:hypothetical protein
VGLASAVPGPVAALQQPLSVLTVEAVSGQLRAALEFEADALAVAVEALRTALEEEVDAHSAARAPPPSVLDLQAASSSLRAMVGVQLGLSVGGKLAGAPAAPSAIAAGLNCSAVRLLQVQPSEGLSRRSSRHSAASSEGSAEGGSGDCSAAAVVVNGGAPNGVQQRSGSVGGRRNYHLGSPALLNSLAGIQLQQIVAQGSGGSRQSSLSAGVGAAYGSATEPMRKAGAVLSPFLSAIQNQGSPSKGGGVKRLLPPLQSAKQ